MKHNSFKEWRESYVKIKSQIKDRQPKTTDWEMYRYLLSEEKVKICKNIRTLEDLQVTRWDLQGSIQKAYKQTWPKKTKASNRNVPW